MGEVEGEGGGVEGVGREGWRRCWVGLGVRERGEGGSGGWWRICMRYADIR